MRFAKEWDKEWVKCDPIWQRYFLEMNFRVKIGEIGMHSYPILIEIYDFSKVVGSKNIFNRSECSTKGINFVIFHLPHVALNP